MTKLENQRNLKNSVSPNNESADLVFERLIKVGIALSAEQDKNRLMETILLEAKIISNADGGTLYIRGNMIEDPLTGQERFEPTAEGTRLKFEIMRTDSLNIAIGGTTGKKISLQPLYIFEPTTGQKNLRNVATAAVLTAAPINVIDAYNSLEFDFSGTKSFDRETGYYSKSFLTVPLANNEGEVIGVLQLLNAKDTQTGEITFFKNSIKPIISALASQAAVALDNQQLLAAQKKLLDSFIKLIASAIDAKSPYTGGHCQRVPELSMMLADAAANSSDGPFANFTLSPDERYEMEIAALLHDCGKVTTPEHVVDKATKLETIYNRIHEIRTRFEVVKRDYEINALKKIIEGKKEPKEIQKKLKQSLAKLDDDFAFIASCNMGGESMEEAAIERIKRIAKIKWLRTLSDQIGLSPDETKFLPKLPKEVLPVEEHILADKPVHKIPHTKDNFENKKNRDWNFNVNIPKYKFHFGEVYNLSVKYGTLTAEERYKINDHIAQTIMMLETLPFPKKLKRVPEYAGGHHEKMDGTGYPRGLAGKDMSVPARIMAIADIFEALSASDRPYKKTKKLSECLKIMANMSANGHIDGDLFDLFLTSEVYKKYSEKFLDPSQLNEPDIADYLTRKRL